MSWPEENTQELAIRRASATPVDSDAPPFARFGRFDLLGRIAVGGMAEILLARESFTWLRDGTPSGAEGGSGLSGFRRSSGRAGESAGSRQLVIKVVRGDYADDGGLAAMFTDEGRLAMRLSHPNICTVYECGREGGRFFIAMEYVHGQTLRNVLIRAAERGRALPIPLLLRIFTLVAEALDFAHRAKDSQGRPLAIVHRDVSPHNIMIRYDGVVKLLDFGVAKAEHAQHSTESGALKGKFGYMSPEQALGDPLDARADIFALGVCLFEAVTGRRLFHRKGQYETLKAILEDEPPPLGAFRDDVPEALEAIVRRALAKDPGERYQRAGDLAHELEGLLAEMRAVASTARIGAFVEELFEEEARRGPELEVDDELRARYATSVSTLPPAPRPRRWKAWIVAGLVLAALGAGALAFSSSPEAAPPSAPVSAPSPTAPAEPSPPAGAPSEPAAPPTEEERSDTMPAAEAARPDEAAEEEEPSRASRNRGTKTGRRSGANARRRGTVIVADPGF